MRSRRSRYARLGDCLVPWDDIRRIDLDRLEASGVVRVYLRGEHSPIELGDAEAVDFVMRIAPSFIEGKRFRWMRWGWAVHNLLGHPLLQILAWAGYRSLGLRVHDATIPRPRWDRDYESQRSLHVHRR